MKSASQPQGRLSLWDTTSIIVGIIIGASIFRSLPLIAHNTTPISNLLHVNPLVGLGIAWAVGGLAAWMGAVCYAELASAYPEDGGTYVYLRRGLGRRTALLYAWIEFWIVRPGNMGAVAFVLGRYAEQVLSLRGIVGQSFMPAETWWALLAVAAMTLLNLGGVTLEKWVQNGLTIAKLGGLAVIVLLAFLVPLWRTEVAAVSPPTYPPNLGLAMVLIMFAYGGWSDVVNIAAEVREPQRNLTRALFLGLAAVVGVYLLTNLAFVTAFGFNGVRGASAVAANVMELYFGNVGSIAISGLIVLSCLGAIHGMIFTTSRAFYAAGKDHPLLHWLGAWNEKREIPLRAVALQGVVTILLIALLGRSADGFERLVVFTGPFFWFAFVIVAYVLISLRETDSTTHRPYLVPFYPILPAAFAMTSLLMGFASVDYLRNNMQGYDWLWVLLVIVGGGLLVGFARESRKQA